MSAPLCTRLISIDLGPVTAAIHAVADGQVGVDVTEAVRVADDAIEVLLRAKGVLLRIHSGELSQADARLMCPRLSRRTGRGNGK